MRLRGYGATDVGLVREGNEDSFLIDDARSLFGVADGMGGHQAGEVASQLALDTVAKVITLNSEANHDLIHEAVKSANEAVYAWGQGNDIDGGMGTTLTFMYAPDGNTAWIGHVGDSRAYRVNDEEVEQITTDHSWVQAQVDAGLLSPQEAARHPMRNVITQSVGFERGVSADVASFAIEAGSYYLIASDGLTNKVTDEEIGVIVRNIAPASPNQAIMELIELAKQRGGEDNITVALIFAEK